ncbi:MAG: alpha-N-arabinofuranosidase [Prevotella sp.]|nr:alpha-N-arabinofuranosidase [Prevotella sp.]
MKPIILSLAILFCSLHGYCQNIQVNIQANNPQQTINKHIYGHFAEHLGRCIYDGFWVDENLPVEKKDRIRLDIVKALKEINIPNLRWPGGCYADEYQWKSGIGIREKRPVTINSHWGGVVEDNSFGTHEFLELCELLECEPYISANVGSGTVYEMREWIEYLNFAGKSTLTETRAQNGKDKPWGVKFWGIGNESWGCGGDMTPEYYSNEYKRYQSYARNYSGNNLMKIACGPNIADYNWMEVCMKNIPNWMMWGISLHYYTIPTGDWGRKGSATQFDEKEYFNTMKNALYMEELLEKHTAIMDKYDPRRNVALVVDEWGIWTDVEPDTNPGFLYQQNSMRDALIAASTLNIFNKYSHRVRVANLAQTINVLQALILTEGEKMLLTPTYHIFNMYKVHHEAIMLPVQLGHHQYEVEENKIPALNASASKDKDGKIHVTIVNLDAKKNNIAEIAIDGATTKTINGEILTSSSFSDHNTFDQPGKVKPGKFDNIKKSNNKIIAELPPLSVVVLTIES